MNGEWEAAWRLEIARRVAELDAGTAETITWDELKEKLRKRLTEKKNTPKRQD